VCVWRKTSRSPGDGRGRNLQEKGEFEYVDPTGGETLQSVVGDRGPLEHLLAADGDLLDNDGSLIVHDAERPPAFLGYMRRLPLLLFCYCGRWVARMV
jgi:hypothetical protein